MDVIKVMIIEDDEECFLAEKRIIEQHQDMVVVGLIKEKSDVIALTEKWKPDVALVDIHLSSKEEQYGIEIAIQLSMAFPNLKIIIVSGILSEDSVRSTMGIGAACNYILKNNMNQLPQVIRDAYYGNVQIDSDVINYILKDYRKSLQCSIKRSLTQHELKILELFYRGYSVEQVANAICVEPQSVRNAQQRISKKCYGWKWRFRKLNTYELAKRAKKLGLF